MGEKTDYFAAPSLKLIEKILVVKVKGCVIGYSETDPFGDCISCKKIVVQERRGICQLEERFHHGMLLEGIGQHVQNLR
jgi:hypothetical protein